MIAPIIVQAVLRGLLTWTLIHVGTHAIINHAVHTHHLASVVWSQAASDPLGARVIILPAFESTLPR